MAHRLSHPYPSDMQRAAGLKKNLLLTLWLCLPFAVLAAIVAIIFLSYGNKKMDARPVGQGAADTGGANALGELLAGNNPIEKERTAKDLREGRLIDPLDWSDGIALTIDGLPGDRALLFTWGERGVARSVSAGSGDSTSIDRKWIESAFQNLGPTAGFYLSTGNLVSRNGRPASEDGAVIKLSFPLVPVADARPGEPLKITIDLSTDPKD